MPLQFPRILVAALASRYNQARLRRAKGWIAFTNGIFDSWEPPILVTVAARPQDSLAGGGRNLNSTTAGDRKCKHCRLARNDFSTK